jgi:triacylglycerol lipase
MTSNYSGMTSDRYPVILVHGWNSHPGIWKKLIVRLEVSGIPYRKFDHSGMQGLPLPEIAESLKNFLLAERDENGWNSPVDIVCHSLGTCIVRYLLEVIDGTEQKQVVRQLIGLGPPNTGSALAELFSDPKRGGKIIDKLTGVFVPKGFNPATDRLVQDVRPGSVVINNLIRAGLRPDITYRIIVTTNPKDVPGFFPWFEGKTWEMAEDGKFKATFDGDGVVAYRESQLPGISLDILSASLKGEDNLPSPDQYCHINLPRNPLVIDRIMKYLTGQANEK